MSLAWRTYPAACCAQGTVLCVCNGAVQQGRAPHVLVSQRLSSTREIAMMPMPTNTPGVLYLLEGSNDSALHSTSKDTDSQQHQHRTLADRAACASSAFCQRIVPLSESESEWHALGVCGMLLVGHIPHSVMNSRQQPKLSQQTKTPSYSSFTRAAKQSRQQAVFSPMQQPP